MHPDLQYALVTSSALPQQIAESEYYVELDKTQWLDLVDYSAEVAGTDENQEILFLIVAKGTEEQIEEDESRRASKEEGAMELARRNEELAAKLGSLSEEKKCLTADHLSLEEELKAVHRRHETAQAEIERLIDMEEREEAEERTQAEQDAVKQERLRERSISLFNALYTKK